MNYIIKRSSRIPSKAFLYNCILCICLNVIFVSKPNGIVTFLKVFVIATVRKIQIQNIVDIIEVSKTKRLG